jgi:hypothetical protein
MKQTCLWFEDEEGNWWTACDNGFTFIDGGPLENGMKYCGYCGNPLTIQSYTDEPTEPDAIDLAKAEMEQRGER